MGLFDELMGITRDLNKIKSEATHTVSQLVSSVTDVKNEAVDTVSQLGQEVTGAKDKLVNSFNEPKDDDNQPKE